MQKSKTLPALPRQVQEFMERGELIEHIGRAHSRKDIRELRALLSSWRPVGNEPTKVARAREDLRKWDIVEGRLPIVLREIIDQRDVGRLRHVMHELETFGPQHVKGLEEAQALMKEYQEHVDLLLSAVAARDAPMLECILHSWNFAETDSHVGVARSVLADIMQEEELAPRRAALASLEQLLEMEPPDLVKIRAAVDTWSFPEDVADGKSGAFVEACRVLAAQEDAIEVALHTSNGWILKHLWEASGSGLALGNGREDLVQRVIVCLEAHEVVVSQQCKTLVAQRHRLRDRNFLAWLPELVNATSKTAMSESLQEQDVNFWPCAWSYPHNSIDKIWEQASRLNMKTLIVKPSLGSQGWGITIASSREDLQKQLAYLKEDEALIQNYVHRPLLLNGFKWDMRVYVLIVPRPGGSLLSFLAREGLARVCVDPYLQPLPRNQHRKSAHLTNYSVNKVSPKFEHAASAEDGHRGCKRSLTAVLRQFDKDTQSPINFRTTWEAIHDLTHQTVRIVLEPLLVSQKSRSIVEAPANERFHLLGLDVLLDEMGKPWLLEVNTKPSMDFDEAIPLALNNQSRAAVNQIFVEDRKRKCVSSANLMKPCRCGALAQVHTHRPSPIDLAVKAPVIEDALKIACRVASAGADGLTKCTDGTIFEPTMPLCSS